MRDLAAKAQSKDQHAAVAEGLLANVDSSHVGNAEIPITRLPARCQEQQAF